MSRVETDEAREHRIHMEIIVDCYGEEERAMGWYCYLQDKLTFPFLAQCIAKRATSPLKVGDEVEVLGMAPDGECEREVFVVMRWEKEGLAVPLSQLEVIHADDDGETEQAACDWLYWSRKGYRFQKNLRLLHCAQIVSSTVGHKTAQDVFSLLGEVGDPLRAIHIQQVHRLKELEHPQIHHELH